MAEALLVKERKDGTHEINIKIKAEPLPVPGSRVEVDGKEYVVDSWLYSPIHEQATVVSYELLICLK